MNKNPDYTESAVKLLKEIPQDIRDLFAKLKADEAASEKIETELENLPQSIEALKLSCEIADIRTAIKEKIDELGSSQDPEAGIYAVKQRKVTMVYSVALVKSRLPELAGDIIEVSESVDRKKIAQLVKDGFTTQESVDQCGRPREAFIYIVEPGIGAPKSEEAPA